jgi:hypothetical protein
MAKAKGKSTAKSEPEAPLIVLRSNTIRIILSGHVFEIERDTEIVHTFKRELLPHARA